MESKLYMFNISVLGFGLLSSGLLWAHSGSGHFVQVRFCLASEYQNRTFGVLDFMFMYGSASPLDQGLASQQNWEKI